MRESMIDVRGQSLRLCEAGSGAPLLFLHGAGGPNWYPLLEMLSAHWHVIAPEHPGFGRSRPPEWMMGVGDLAYFYLDFLEAREFETCISSAIRWAAGPRRRSPSATPRGSRA